MSRRARTTPLDHRVVLAALASVLVVSNLVMLPRIEQRASPDAYKVAHSHGSLHLRDIARYEPPHVRERFPFYLELGAVAAGRELYIFGPIRLRVGDLAGMARPGAVHRVASELTVSAGLASDLRSRAVAEGVLRHVGPFTIVADDPEDGPANGFAVFEHDGRIFAAPLDLLPALDRGDGAPAP
jgi:hypothetical protein